MQRHQLLYLDEEGRALLRAALLNAGALPITEMPSGSTLAQIPAIVRRQQAARPGMVQVGLSLPLWQNGARVRVAATVPQSSVLRSLSPFAVAAAACHCPHIPADILSALVEKGQRAGLAVGLFGSCALQALTGLAYLHPQSDWDILLAARSPSPSLSAFVRDMALLEAEAGLRFDCEILCNGRYGVKLREWMQAPRTVLGKGLYDVQLLPYARVSLCPESTEGL